MCNCSSLVIELGVRVLLNAYLFRERSQRIYIIYNKFVLNYDELIT